jgi:ornithine cyclodeaminase/alanine dehydrogenase-like protein (mu-crystallin family)
MALLIKAEELKGLISLPEAIAAVRDGFRDQGERPAYSAPRIRIQHEDRRVSVHPGGCHRLQVAGTFIHVERFTFRDGAQQYEKAGKRVYVAYDSETAELKTIIVGSLPLFDEPPDDWFGTETPITGAVGTDILARADCRILGLYGTGRQARPGPCLVTLCTIRPSLVEVRLYSEARKPRSVRERMRAAGASSADCGRGASASPRGRRI